MANAQPDPQVITHAMQQIMEEVIKFPNIPTLAQGNALLDQLDRLEQQFVARLQTSSVPGLISLNNLQHPSGKPSLVNWCNCYSI
jgi:hypothetical protein